MTISLPELPPNDPQTPKTIPTPLILGIISVCVMPYLLNQLGFDFGNPRSGFAEGPIPADLQADRLGFAFPHWSDTLLHTLLEWSAFCIAIFTVLFSMVHYYAKREAATLIIALALFSSGCMDAFHVLVADKLVVLPAADDTTLIPFTWALSRGFNALIVIAGAGLLLYVNPRDLRFRVRTILVFCLFFAAAAYAAIRITATSLTLPQTMYPHQFIARPWDMPPLILFLIAGVWIYPAFHRRFPSLFSHALLISVFPDIATQMHMAFGSTAAFDNDFYIAHMLKIVSYMVPLLGLCLDYIHTHRNLAEELRQRGHKTRLIAEIHARRQIENALQDEKERLRVTLSSIGDGVIATRMDGCVDLLNPVAENLTGWSAADAEGRPLDDVFRLIHAGTREPLAIPADLFLDRVGVDAQPLLVAADGTERVVSARGASIGDLDYSHPQGFVFVFSDITEQEKIRAQISLFQKMESIGQLAAGIAHEINSPMQFIGDNTRFLQDGFTDLDRLLSAHMRFAQNLDPTKPPTQAQLDQLEALAEDVEVDYLRTEIPSAVEQSLEGIQRVSDLVAAMKDFSHPDKMEIQPADLNRGVQNTATISRNAWKYVADLELDLDPGMDLVPCVINEINQVVLNLIINAADAVGERKQAGEIGHGRIDVRTERTPDKALITITDNGSGIPESVIHRIFDPFFTTKEIGKGTGQGLSIAHDIIVKRHGGELKVGAGPDGGAQFQISLPLSP